MTVQTSLLSDSMTNLCKIENKLLILTQLFLMNESIILLYKICNKCSVIANQ